LARLANRWRLQMLRRLKEHAGLAALTVAVMALFVALSGIAGALPGKKSVDKNDLKKNAVASKNLAPDALTGADINEGSLNVGGGLNVVQRKANLGPIAGNAAGEATVNCQGNEKVIGGGFAAVTGNGRLDGSRAATNAQGVPTGWIISLGNSSATVPASFEIYALCAS
jgi:hypothetical protein